MPPDASQDRSKAATDAPRPPQEAHRSSPDDCPQTQGEPHKTSSKVAPDTQRALHCRKSLPRRLCTNAGWHRKRPKMLQVDHTTSQIITLRSMKCPNATHSKATLRRRLICTEEHFVALFRRFSVLVGSGAHRESLKRVIPVSVAWAGYDDIGFDKNETSLCAP